MKITGRKKEKIILRDLTYSDKPEFVAVYGRRRVGKTFLIREFFTNNFSFYLTGISNENTKSQLKNFNTSLQKYGKMPYPLVNNWLDGFQQLIHLLENTSVKGKKVVFMDELPWMDTPKSGFISALEHFWNSWASARNDVLFIVCGSATSWVMNNLIRNYGGLHNRVTAKIYLEPFTLGECEAYFKDANIELNRYHILESYMIFGGIPYYLSLFKKGYSLAQNVDRLCFAINGELSSEFTSLYSSLFKHSENYMKLVEFIAGKKKGMLREEIIQSGILSNGGGLTKVLDDLENCGFIRRYKAFGKPRKNQLYQLTDFYSLFYLYFIRKKKNDDESFWVNSVESPQHRAWSGYAFERVCLAHIRQIKNKLGISGVSTEISAWRSQVSDPGAQIDLVIDRKDQIINLCEIKFSVSEFIIDKSYDMTLRNKKEVFRNETQTRKALHTTLITSFGVKKNEYSGMIQSEITSDDLF
jgi:uncharacterized protein